MTINTGAGRLPRRRGVALVGAVLVVALIAGCTTIAGNPRADVGSENGAESGETSYSSTEKPAATGADDTDGDSYGDEAADDTDATDSIEVPPTSWKLIADALEAGEIDEPTSLLYRTWAQFDPTLLPDEFQGIVGGHDTELLTSMPARLDELPDDIRAQVEPYFLRPTDPRSIYNAGANPPGLRSAHPSQLLSEKSEPEQGKCHGGWMNKPVEGLPFMVWACLDMNYSDPDPDVTAEDVAEAKLTQVAGVVSKHAGRMIADMGPVIPDVPDSGPDPRADSSIDIYLLPSEQVVGPTRNGEVTTISDAEMATVGTEPYPDSTTTSAFVMALESNLHDPPQFERFLVHELFHVLQYTHNARMSNRWFYEASAEWASSYYVRSDSARLHKMRLPILQNATWTSLQAPNDGGMHVYGAYLWPLFMEQEVGPQSIFDTWQELGGLPAGAGNAELIKVMHHHLDVSKNFPEFVMRMYNANDLKGDPISPRFVDLDKHFPDGLTPTAWSGRTLAFGDPLKIDAAYVPDLGYKYVPVTVPVAPGEDDHGVMVTITGDAETTDGQLPSLEALVRGEDDEYTRQKIHYQGDGQAVCVKGQIILVLANQSTDWALKGSIDLERERDENGKEKRCGTVEADNPETFTKLANNGERVRVSGTENDGKPDSVTIVVTVSDVPKDRVAKYQVKVRLTGPTLDVPRDFTWSLSDFDTLGESGKYRKSTTVLLDNDLTDHNRNLTIDTRLELTTDHRRISAHKPTVELHGKRPCALTRDELLAADPDDAEATHCRLEGTLHFSYSGNYDAGPDSRPNIHTTAKWDGDLTVRLKQGTILGDSRTTFVDDGSAWSMSGAARLERCAPQVNGGGIVCDGDIVDETFSDDDPNRPYGGGEITGDDDLAALAAEINPRLNVYLQPPTAGHPEQQPVVRVRVPIEQNIKTSGSLADGHEPPDQYSEWELGCPTPPTESWNANNRFWNDAGFYTGLEEGDTDLVGRWNEQHTVLDVECDQSWPLTGGTIIGQSLGTGTVSYSVSGELHLVRE